MNNNVNEQEMNMKQKNEKKEKIRKLREKETY